MFDKARIPFVVLDVVCVVLAVLPLGVLKLITKKPYQRGFFCNDESIKYPFHDSTVTSTVLYTVGFTVPICSEYCLSSRLSFYSGHSSFSMYCMLFLALYLQARMRGDWARLLRPTIQFALVAVSIYVGLSRVSDYKHHWSDVLTGLIQGAIIAVLIVVYVSDFFKMKKTGFSQKEEDSHTTLHETSTNGNHYGNSHQP
ncbi:hypothetical protein GDO81_002808 [Engystomops pustulosus]|uniref:Phospholipid phosphatase 1 n=1 Tax=Engystomops pustulosus TaxID=76066 RepID=A0AAV7DQL6_ENGPU|nr:hypothetical protein GDO81_002808 [Engystomops pustulosus]